MIVDGKKLTITGVYRNNMAAGNCTEYWTQGARNAVHIVRVWENGKVEILLNGSRKGWSKVTSWSVN